MRAWEVVVVGAGPAGALATREAARLGAEVLLLDRARCPRWKVCGACLSPGALGVLEAVGLGDLVASAGGRRLRTFRLYSGGARPASLSLPGSVSLSRASLDSALVAAACEAGATFVPEARVALAGVERGARLLEVLRGGRVERVRARVVVDATGLGTGLAREGAAEVVVDADSRLGVGAVLAEPRYPVGLGELHMVVGRSGYVGLVRVEGGALTVAAALAPEAVRAASPAAAVGALLAEVGLPPLAEAPLEGWRGTPLLTRDREAAAQERLFQIGDAAGYVEPFTGEGIGWALSAGRAVAPLAVAAAERWQGELAEEWLNYRERSLRPAQRLCRTLAWALRRPRLVTAAVTALGVAPGLAAPFVARAGRAPAPLAARTEAA